MCKNIKMNFRGRVAIKIISVVFLLMSGNLHSQNDVWFYGTANYGIDFSSGTAVAKNGVSGVIFYETVTVTGD